MVGVDVKVKQQQPSSNVNTAENLEGVPVKFLSGDNKCPLLSMDAAGNQYKHYLTPMIKSAMFILVVEGLERFCFYGVSFTQTSFMLGAYNDVNQGWSPNFSTTEAVGLTALKWDYSSPIQASGEYHSFMVYGIPQFHFVDIICTNL